jgi:hypothetical protein
LTKRKALQHASGSQEGFPEEVTLKLISEGGRSQLPAGLSARLVYGGHTVLDPGWNWPAWSYGKAILTLSSVTSHGIIGYDPEQRYRAPTFLRWVYEDEA